MPALQGTFQRLRGPVLWVKRPQHWLCFLVPFFQGWAGEVLGQGGELWCPLLSAFGQPTENCLVSQECVVTIAHSLPSPFMERLMAISCYCCKLPFVSISPHPPMYFPFSDWRTPQGSLSWSFPSKSGLSLFSLKAFSLPRYIACPRYYVPGVKVRITFFSETLYLA